MRTRAAVLHRIGEPFVIEDLELEPPRAGEVLVRILAAGVCRSDHHLLTGATRHPLPVAVGHEGAGLVEELGPGVTSLRPGDLVALDWAPSCGGCFYCLRGRPALCSAFHAPIWAGTLLDGTTRLRLQGQPVFHYCGLACFAERAVVPAVSCVPLPLDVPPAVAALIGCAVTTGVGAVLNTARVPAGSSVAVYGAGGVGLSIILAARMVGAAPIIAVDPLPTRRDMALGLGAGAAYPPGPGAVEAIRAATGGRGADFVFEAAGVPASQEECLEAARPAGTVALVGIAPMGSVLKVSGASLTREEKTLVGSYYGSAVPARDFPLYADLHRSGRLDLGRLVTARYRLEEINRAYDDLLAGKTARGILEPGNQGHGN